MKGASLGAVRKTTVARTLVIISSPRYEAAKMAAKVALTLGVGVRVRVRRG